MHLYHLYFLTTAAAAIWCAVVLCRYNYIISHTHKVAMKVLMFGVTKQASPLAVQRAIVLIEEQALKHFIPNMDIQVRPNGGIYISWTTKFSITERKINPDGSWTTSRKNLKEKK